jgi:fatty acid desaturase
VLAPFAALAVFMLAFAVTHDAAHGALGLPRRATNVVLAVGGVAIGTSGHALRLMHMRHHAHELAPDDLEGAAARMTFWQALAHAPRLSLALHVAAWRTGRQRSWQVIEYLGLAAVIAAAGFGPRPLAIYAAVALGMQVLAPWWAGHIPHRSEILIALARRLAVTGSPTLASLAHHDLHHRRPKLPTWRLQAASIAEE